MGAPKQKWTAEEESALKAGVARHGTGKWRNILKDPDFCMILRFRSNIDLKDKWRNMNVTAGGWGSRERLKSAIRKSKRIYKNKSESEEDSNPLAVSTELEEQDSGNSVICATDPMLIESGYSREKTRLDSLILDAIRNLNEPNGSNKTAITMYIEESFWPPDDFQRLLSTELNTLVNSGKLIKVKQNYKIAPRKNQLKKPRTPRTLPTDDVKLLTFPDAELAMMRGSTNEAADFAARLVVEAELAVAAAEEASRIAEEAEADAQAAQAFVQAAIISFKNRSPHLMLRA
ncbi:hypothetical protein LUZ60_008532 [Juncus effusus]|nr:hypothetical protein LUZ60_008532 [Juncus effusus]